MVEGREAGGFNSMSNKSQLLTIDETGNLCGIDCSYW